MKTSSEIKQFVIERLEAKDPLALYMEFFKEIGEEHNVLHVKGVQSRWQCACREVSKEKGWNGIDETFPKSIFAYNAVMNAMKEEKPERSYRAIKDAFGWDVKAIADGKHCNIAQIIINALQESFIENQKERLGLK